MLGIPPNYSTLTLLLFGISMQLSISDLIAGLALIISLFAVFYAKRNVDATRITARTSLHQPRIEIFQTLFWFRSLFVEMDLHPTYDEIQQFYVKAVLPAQLYISAPLTQRMYEIYKKSSELYKEIEWAEEHGPSGSKWTHTNELQALGKNDLDQLIRDMAKEYDLGNV